MLCTTADALLSCQTQAISNTSCFHFGELLDHPNISALEESPDTKAHVSEALLKGSASPRPDHACLPDHARLKSTSCGLLLFPLYGKSPCRRSHCDDVNELITNLCPALSGILSSSNSCAFLPMAHTMITCRDLRCPSLMRPRCSAVPSICP